MDSRATPSCDFEAEPFDENSWVDLLSLIEEGEVVPVVGPELMEIDGGNGPELFHTWAARALAESFRLSRDVRGPEPTLNSVISLLALQGKRQSAYTRLVTLVQDKNLEPPEALRQLAEIPVFSFTSRRTSTRFSRRRSTGSGARARRSPKRLPFIHGNRSI
jgi:hypothetical protein